MVPIRLPPRGLAERTLEWMMRLPDMENSILRPADSQKLGVLVSERRR